VHPTSKGTLKGSARSTDTITNLKELVQQSETTILAQGHEGAFGIEFENIDKIKECISFVSEKLPNVELEVASYIECKSDLDYVLSQRDDIYDCVWGTNLKEPKFIYTDNVTKENISLIGKQQNVLKINKDFEVCKFQYDIDKFSETFPFDKFKFKIYCLGTPNLNTYKQVTRKQFLAEKVASVPIE
jgi:single-stranded DNA-specific DHH superfamily exonuclease